MFTLWRAIVTAASRFALAGSTGFLTRDLGTFFSRFGEADGDGLLATLYAPALATFAGAKSAALSSAHSAGNSFARPPTVPAT